MVAPDGSRTHSISGVVQGPRGTFSLISSGRASDDVKANFALFVMPLLVLSGGGAQQ
jgi:hypothetical protein